MSEFVVGARQSPLAVRQTELVLATLRKGSPELKIRLQTIRTLADRHPDLMLEQLLEIGVFVKELEVALLAGQIDAAVHGMKDLPSSIPDGLAIAAITEREDPRDVLVARDGLALETLPAGARVGTSSPRRAAQLKAQRPDLEIVPIRGNIDTRIRKVDSGEVDAVCLAGAGLRRAGLEGRITQWLPLEISLPAPGQGALGVEVRAGDLQAIRITSCADHAPTRAAVEAERAVLRRLEGGCRVPLGALAHIDGDQMFLTAMVASADRERVIRGVRTGRVEDAVTLGTSLADELLAKGAAELVAIARSEEQR